MAHVSRRAEMRLALRAKLKKKQTSTSVRQRIISAIRRQAGGGPDKEVVLRFWRELPLSEATNVLDFTNTHSELIQHVWQLNVNLLCAGLFQQATAAAVARTRQGSARTFDSYPLLEAVEFTNEADGTLAVKESALRSREAFLSVLQDCVDDLFTCTGSMSEAAFRAVFIAEAARCDHWLGMQQLVGSLIERQMVQHFMKHMEAVALAKMQALILEEDNEAKAQIQLACAGGTKKKNKRKKQKQRKRKSKNKNSKKKHRPEEGHEEGAQTLLVQQKQVVDTRPTVMMSTPPRNRSSSASEPEFARPSPSSPPSPCFGLPLQSVALSPTNDSPKSRAYDEPNPDDRSRRISFFSRQAGASTQGTAKRKRLQLDLSTADAALGTQDDLSCRPASSKRQCHFASYSGDAEATALQAKLEETYRVTARLTGYTAESASVPEPTEAAGTGSKLSAMAAEFVASGEWWNSCAEHGNHTSTPSATPLSAHAPMCWPWSAAVPPHLLLHPAVSLRQQLLFDLRLNPLEYTSTTRASRMAPPSPVVQSPSLHEPPSAEGIVELYQPSPRLTPGTVDPQAFRFEGIPPLPPAATSWLH